MIRFEDLLDKVRGYSPDADLELLRKAYVFSALEHKGQIRHSGEPYLVHPLEVADILADMKLDAVCIAAGLLHDVVEDTLTTPEKIREKFGEDVAHIVEGVTKIGAIPFSSTRRAPGGKLPQDAAGDGRRHPRHPRQARRPPPQHAHAAAHGRRQARPHRAGDARHLRADRQSPRHEPHQERARGAVVPLPRAGGVSVAEEPRRSQAPAHAGHDRAAGRRHPQQAERGAGAGDQHRRPRQAPLQHLAEAEGAEDRSRAGLRLRRAAHRHAVGEGLLRRARHHSPDVVAGARAASRTSSRCRGRTAISRCTPR